MTNYAGIDYSLGQSNVDREAGIHYGVISQNSIMLECLDNVEYDYGDPTCGECGNAAVNSDDLSITNEDWNEGKDYACAQCRRVFWSDEAFPDQPNGWTLEDSEYSLVPCLDNDIFVLKSPYYTFAQFCSPCVPGAGNLDTPCESGPKTYCLGHDWFDEGKAPYPVYSVKTDEEIKPN